MTTFYLVYKKYELETLGPIFSPQWVTIERKNFLEDDANIEHSSWVTTEETKEFEI